MIDETQEFDKYFERTKALSEKICGHTFEFNGHECTATDMRVIVQTAPNRCFIGHIFSMQRSHLMWCVDANTMASIFNAKHKEVSDNGE